MVNYVDISKWKSPNKTSLENFITVYDLKPQTVYVEEKEKKVGMK